jgi:interferon gamma-inducible protein 30
MSVSVQLSMEALCPDCINYSATQISALMSAVPSIVSLSVLPYGNASPNSSTGGWDCQHGVNECIGNMYLACAQSHFPTVDAATSIPQWYPFYECMESSNDNKNRVGPYNTTAAITCAEGLDWNIISDCAGPDPSLGSENDGSPLMQSIAEATPEHTYVPWVVVDGATVADDGDGYPAGDLTEIVCKAYEGDELPDACGGD